MVATDPNYKYENLIEGFTTNKMGRAFDETYDSYRYDNDLPEFALGLNVAHRSARFWQGKHGKAKTRLAAFFGFPTSVERKRRYLNIAIAILFCVPTFLKNVAKLPEVLFRFIEKIAESALNYAERPNRGMFLRELSALAAALLSPFVAIRLIYTAMLSPVKSAEHAYHYFVNVCKWGIGAGRFFVFLSMAVSFATWLVAATFFPPLLMNGMSGFVGLFSSSAGASVNAALTTAWSAVTELCGTIPAVMGATFAVGVSLLVGARALIKRIFKYNPEKTVPAHGIDPIDENEYQEIDSMPTRLIHAGRHSKQDKPEEYKKSARMHEEKNQNRRSPIFALPPSPSQAGTFAPKKSRIHARTAQAQRTQSQSSEGISRDPSVGVVLAAASRQAASVKGAKKPQVRR